jgi:hypothetical protein
MPPVSEPCNTPVLKHDARRACVYLNDQQDSFAICNRHINVTEYLNNCERDYCMAVRRKQNVEPVLCNAFAAYASQCAEKLIFVEWRREDRCRK